ncbi:hypothetical protein CF055_00205 [Clostridium botulinum]|uniref:hypothetical protein n=1 Tax=Clostridium botulinum TaxID=1491 RepID=UPI000A171882|nr:hypothetical protein [Clostridium botulinum]AUN10692.1 hypothetical protein RSJ6_09340 [Clostridium botulinum]OSA71059.1 hypothetical protein B2H87_11895 [Clostridium botulinum]
MKLYVIESKENINGILSTGIISPEIFYYKRNFGTNRYFSNIFNSNKYFITLYKYIPEQIKNYDNVIIIEININKKNKKLIKISDDIFLYPGSLYKEKHKMKLLVPKEYLESIIKSASIVREIKINNLIDMLKKQNKFTYKNINVNLIKNDLYNDNIFENQYIYIDSILDKIKGYFLLNIYFKDFSFVKFSSEKELIDLIYNYHNMLQNLKKYNNIRGINKLKNSMDEIFNINKNQSSNISFTNKDNINIKFISLNKEDQQLFNIFTNILIKKSPCKQGYFSKEDLKKILIQISNHKIITDNSQYTHQLKIIYSRAINDDTRISVDNINNNVFKNLYISLLKYDNIDEFRNMLLNKNIKNKFIGITFVSIIRGYSDLTRKVSGAMKIKYINEFANNKICKIEEILEQKYIDDCYEKNIIKNINMINKDHNLFKLKVNKDLLDNFNIELKNYGTRFVINIKNKFQIVLYTKIYNRLYTKFINKNKKLKIYINNDKNKYKFFTYNKMDTMKNKKLSYIDKKELNDILEELI